MTSTRTLIIGLDGATFDLIDPMIEAGDLPALERLQASGVRGVLDTWPNTNSAAAWSSMITGYNSGRHGIYHFGEAIMRRGAEWRPVTARDRMKDPFWRTLSAAGQHVGVINVPISYPADEVHGFMLAGMDTPGLGSPGFAHPPDLVRSLKSAGIDYRLDVANLGVLSRRDPYNLPDSVRRMIDARGRTLLHLMETRPWDMMMAVFVATDRVQHYYWPQDLSSIESRDWQAVRDVYRQIDSFIERMLSLIDEQTTVLIVSDHGFGPAQSAKRKLNDILAELGLLKFSSPSVSAGIKGRILHNLLVYGRRFIPHSLQDRLARAMPALHLRAVNEHRYSGIDWSGTRVWTSPAGGRVWINLKGRELDGTVDAQDYDSLCERVREILLNLYDPATSAKVVTSVRRREELYSGPFLDKAADLTIEWDSRMLGDALCYESGGERRLPGRVEKADSGPGWNGTHRPEGIFIARGPDIKRGVIAEKVTIYDIAPTVLYLQGQSVPDDADGRVLRDIFDDDRLRDYPVRLHKVEEGETASQAAELDETEARQIEERLRDLGYIE
ncbi:MAG: alkaline phosphatase family protein [Blastocatellia bacterium]|nr:alkaline phosphatase family protein [Blastocatellia bacterium]